MLAPLAKRCRRRLGGIAIRVLIVVPLLLILLLLRTCALASSKIWLEEISRFDPEAKIQVDTSELMVI